MFDEGEGITIRLTIWSGLLVQRHIGHVVSVHVGVESDADVSGVSELWSGNSENEVVTVVTLFVLSSTEESSHKCEIVCVCA